MTLFDPRNSSSTYAWSMNNAGTIAGDYWDSVHVGEQHSYVRESDGTITSFDVGQGGITTAASINNIGEITGGYESLPRHRAYVRAPNGRITALPGAYVRYADGTVTTFSIQGAPDLAPTGIKDNGVVVGWYQDQSGEAHGFVGTP